MPDHSQPEPKAYSQRELAERRLLRAQAQAKTGPPVEPARVPAKALVVRVGNIFSKDRVTLHGCHRSPTVPGFYFGQDKLGHTWTFTEDQIIATAIQ